MSDNHDYVAKKNRYLQVEEPDRSATIDFLGEYGFSVSLSLENNQLHVRILDAEYPNPILLDLLIEVPKCENKQDNEEGGTIYE
jgi:hypothetical protein